MNNMGFYRNLKIKLNNFIRGNYENYKVEPVKTEFCISFRYDMDDLFEDDFRFFLDKKKSYLGNSTLFVLPYQLKSFKNLIKEIAAKDKLDIQFHSMARPKFFIINNKILNEYIYCRNLKKSFKKFSNWNFSGHAPHGENNYLCYGIETDFNIIEAATMDSGFSWISNYRIVRNLLNDGAFPAVLPVYNIVKKNKMKKTMVFSPAWADTYFFSNDFSKNLLSELSIKTLEKAKKEIEFKLNICRHLNTPFIIVLHPHNWLYRKHPGYDLKIWLENYAGKNKIEIKNLSQLFDKYKGT